MRLLRCKEDGEYSVTEFFGDDIPRYAILSHTWGTNDEEVTFKDLSEGKGRTKPGFKKIEFCGAQGAKDGLSFFWVDTCCIDKTSSSELAEAINSMYKWYGKAARCYVYLPDVTARGFASNDGAFERSRWFTRGWTLQELIAPASVEFFSVEGQRLGDKRSMVDKLHTITHVSAKALTDGSRRSLDEIAVEERMSWMEHRQTKREEDEAYSLLGIFDVHMSLIYAEGRDNAFDRLEGKIERRLRDGPPLRRNTFRNEPFSTVPFAPDPDFVDRPELLSWVHDKCGRPGGRAALVGLGGIGKSQLAIQYAHDVRSAAPHKFVFWVHAGTRARFEHAYREIADRLQLPGRNDTKLDVLKLVSDWLGDETRGQWTMVLDNIDHVETLYPSPGGEQDNCIQLTLSDYLPQSRNGSILVTSRSKDAATMLVGDSHIKDIRPMNEHESLQLLRNRLRDTTSEDGTVELLDALGHVPLAISQAAAYINRRAHMSTTSYLKELRANNAKKENLLSWNAGDLRRDESASNSIVAIWQMSFERIRQERPSAADLLSLMSFFSPQSIPEPTLRRYTRSSVDTGDLDKADQRFEADIDLLQAYSLVTATAGTDTCEMHALVQFCMRLWLSSRGDEKRWEHVFINLMAVEFPSGTYENWTQCQQLLPHVELLFNSEPLDDASAKAWAQLLANIAWYLRMQGNYDTAQRIAAKALVEQERILGSDHEVTTESMNNLALALQAQGKYDEAEGYLQKTLAARRRMRGPNHESTLLSVNNLAGLFQDQGKFEEAEKLHRQALEIRKKELGEQHSETLRTNSDLALALHAQAKYVEAEDLHRQVLVGRKNELGDLHPDTLSSINNLGGVLQVQAKSGEAETFYGQAVKGRTEVLGEHHPSTLTSMSNLASILVDLEKYEEAEALSRQVLERRGIEVGEQHPDTLTSVSVLARVLKARGRFEESERLCRKALEGRERQLGEQHPDTLTSMNNLAHVLAELARYAEAVEFFRRAFEGLQQRFGPEHPWTIDCRESLLAMHREVEQARCQPRRSLYARFKAWVCKEE